MSSLNEAHRVRSRSVLLIVLAVTVLLGVPATLWLLGERAVSQVVATTGVPDCTGTRSGVSTDDDGFRQHAISMTRGFRCTVTVRVSNASSAEVGLDRMLVPVAGPGAASAVRVTRIGGAAVAADDEIDAVMTLDQSIPGGGEVSIELDLELRPSGCLSPEATMEIWPVLDVGHLWASHDVQVTGFPVVVGTADSSCDS